VKRFVILAIALLGGLALVRAAVRLPERTSSAPVQPRPVAPPQRIVSATLATDEILLSLIEPSRIAALTYYADDPGISNVTDRAGIVPKRIRADAEEIVALAPDFVFVARYTNEELLRFLEGAGLAVFKFQHFESIRAIQENIRTVGRAVHAGSKAEEVIAWMNERMSMRVYEAQPRVLYYTPDGFTAGAETVIDEIITRAGGRNVAREIGIVKHKRISLEEIIRSDPEHIVMGAGRKLAPLDHPALKNVAAVRFGNVHSVPSKHLTCMSQYCVLGIEEMAKVIHK